MTKAATDRRIAVTFDSRRKQLDTESPIQGPYALLGYSFGGLLAYEIATRLSRMGQTVEFLGLIDTDVQDGALPLMAWLRFRFERLMHLRHRTAALGAGRALTRAWTKLRHLPRHHEAVRAQLEGGAHLNLPPILRQVRFACEQAFAAYNPPSYPQVVTFFRSPERRPYFCDPLTVWRRNAASVRVIDMPGSHITMMLEPHVGALATEIAASLASAASVVPPNTSALAATAAAKRLKNYVTGTDKRPEDHTGQIAV